MKTIKCDDQLGSRGRSKKNLLVVAHQGVVEFKGSSIPPVCRVIKDTFTKNGKWSHSTWEVELTEDAFMVTIQQDFGTGQWFTSPTWQGVLQEFRKLLPAEVRSTLTDEQIRPAIRCIFPKVAEKLDLEDVAWTNEDVFQQLLQAQKALDAAKKSHSDLEKEVDGLIQAEEQRKEAEATRERVAKARKAMSQGVSLEDLKALLSQ